jgi:hypothetical protein
MADQVGQEVRSARQPWTEQCEVSPCERGESTPTPFGHRILRLLQPGTDSGTKVVLCRLGSSCARPVSFRREQSVSRDHTLRHEQENHNTG